MTDFGSILAPDAAERQEIWENLVTVLPWLVQPDGARLRIIEVAGDGFFVEKFATAGHTALLLNADPAVLDAARDRLVGLGDAIVGTVALVRAPIAQIGQRWQTATFDLVLCHQVFDRSFDPRLVLATLTAAVRPGGHLSLAFQDRASAPYVALHAGDAAGALALMGGEGPDAPGLAPDEVARWIREADFQLLGGRAIGAISAAGFAGDDLAAREAARELAARGPAAVARLRHMIARRPAVFPMPL